MKRVGFLLQVKKDKLAEYKQTRKAVWPEMLAAYGLLFGNFEAAESFAASLTGRPDQNMIELDEVFHTN